MPFRLDIDLDGDVQLSRGLLRMGDRAKDMRPAFRELRKRLRRSEVKQFASEGRHASGGWDPLEQATLRQKNRKGQPAKVLQAKGDLLRSLTRPSADFQINVIERDEMQYGTTVPHAKYHQKGTTNMPRRRPLEIRRQDRTDFVKVIQRFWIGRK